MAKHCAHILEVKLIIKKNKMFLEVWLIKGAQIWILIVNLKMLHDFVTSLDYWGGWACFCCSILMIGLLTAVIGDLASGFGCTVGLQDSVTAISFVALGTSVPGIFQTTYSLFTSP